MGSKRRVVMKDIADKLGLHQSTVSLALRNHPRIPRETCERVQCAARELGYVPDPMLSSLIAYRKEIGRSYGANVIAFVINLNDKSEYEASHVHRRQVEGARLRASELGYKLEVFWFGRDYRDGAALEKVIRARGIRGVILGSLRKYPLQISMDWSSLSVLKIDLYPSELAFDTVVPNQLESIRLAMQHLKQDQPLRIGLAVSDRDEQQNRHLFTAGYYLGSMELPAVSAIPVYIFGSKEVPGSLVDKVARWASQHQLDVLMSNWNNLDAATERMERISGKHCRFVSVDADERTMPWGGVCQLHDVIGRVAVDQLVSKMQTFRYGFSEHPATTMIDPVWVESDSSGDFSAVATTDGNDRSPSLDGL